MINLLKDKKAVSPVIAVLLMVAIAVVAALITYSWVTGFVTTTTTKAGHAIQIQGVDKGNDIVYVQNVGEGSVVVSGVLVNGTLATSVDATVDTTSYTLGTDELSEGQVLKLTINDANIDIKTGDKIRVICKDGTFTEYVVP